MKAKNEEQLANSPRLADRILNALELALDQEDPVMAEGLVRVLELSMTRNAGGLQFTDKRVYPEGIETALNRVAKLKEKLS